MKICNYRYKLCYVNRFLESVIVYFDTLIDVCDFVDRYDSKILYIKYCYDFQKRNYIYNNFLIERVGFSD